MIFFLAFAPRKWALPPHGAEVFSFAWIGAKFCIYRIVSIVEMCEDSWIELEITI